MRATHVTPLFAAILTVCAADVTAQKPPQKPEKNLLRNGGFEEGGTHDARFWDEIWPRQALKKPPLFDRSKAKAHGGQSAATLTVPQAGGYCSFTQHITAPPPDARTVRLDGWVEWTPDPSGGKGAPSLMLLFDSPKPSGSDTISEAKLPADASGWTRVSLSAEVPPGSVTWYVRCGVFGTGSARFDDIMLTAIDRPSEAVCLVAAHGDYYLVDNGDSVDPWLEFSIPFPFEGQTPLALKLTTDPPGRLSRTEVIAEGENRFLRAHLAASGKDARTDVRLEALVLVRDRHLGKGDGVALAPRSKLPPDVSKFFGATPGIDADDEAIRAVARKFRKATLAEAATDLNAWMRENIRYEGQGDQGGRATLERKYAVCTGHANLSASLLQAAGVPCRILGCLMGARLQEHYIVEVWTSAEGWRRIESTVHAFPIEDSKHLILHVAHPDFPRSPFNVPLKIDAAAACSAHFRMGADGCWQGMTPAASLALDPGDAKRFEEAARAAFMTWETQPSASPFARLLSSGDTHSAAATDAAKLAALIDAFVGVTK